MKGKMDVATKYSDSRIIEQVNNFNYLGYTITATSNRDLEVKMNRFNQMCRTIRTLNDNTRSDTQIKYFKLWRYLYLHINEKFEV
jgi:hypothetical protein